MQKLAVGQLDLYILNDGTWPFPAHFFFRDLPASAWAPGLALDAAGQIPVGHNYALLKTNSDLLLMDTGYGDETHGGLTGHLLEELERTGYQPEQVTKVILTHPDGDHIQGNTLLRDGQRAPAFPNAQYYLSQADWDWANAPERFEPGGAFDTHVAALAQLGMLTLTQGETQITPEVRLLPTPGHTPGHLSVLIQGAGQTAIFLGDLCHHTLQFAHPDWVTTFDSHPQLTPQSRLRLFELALAHDALLVCTHAPYPALGRLERAGPGVVWRPL